MASTQQLIDQQGQLTQTSSPLDLAISGQGFFVTTSQATNITPTDPRSFTRAGSFTVNNQGYLVNSAGLVLQGWLADSDGKITPNPSSLTSLQSINVSQVGGAVEPTTTIGVNANVDSGADGVGGGHRGWRGPARRRRLQSRSPTAWRCTRPTPPPACSLTTASRSRSPTRRAASTPFSSTS